MDDEQILAKGGDEEDIRRYAEKDTYIGGVGEHREATVLDKIKDIRIGMLRQWLNEDRNCTPMVTNEDIKTWLEIK